MVEPPDEYDSGRWHVGVYAGSDEDDKRGWDIRWFDTSDLDRDEVEADVDPDDLIYDALGYDLDRRSFQTGDLVAVYGLEDMARRGWQVARSSFRPGVRLLKERATDDDGNLLRSVGQEWQAIHPRGAMQLSEGDLIEATTLGFVIETRPEGVVYGNPDGRQYILRPESPGSISAVYRWDPDTEQMEGRDAGSSDPVFTPYTVLVHRNDPQDPIYGIVPETDEGYSPGDPFHESDFPNGYDLEPFIRSQEEANEYIGEQVFWRNNSLWVREGEVDAELPDAAGLRLRYNVDLTTEYILPASSKSSESDVTLVAVPAEEPLYADTTDRREYVRETYYQDEAQEFEVGGRQGEEGILTADEVSVLLTYARPGDRFILQSPGAGVPKGEMVVVDTGGPSGEGEATLRPVNGSKEYVLLARDQDRTGTGMAPLRLRERDGFDSVGRIQGFLVRSGDPVSDDTTTEEEDEPDDMSSNPPERMVQQRYDSLGTTEEAVLRRIEEMGFPTDLTDYDGIGPARAEALEEYGIDNAADLAVTARDGSANQDAFAPLSRAVEELNSRGREQVLEAADTLRDFALAASDDDDGADDGIDPFPFETEVIWNGESVDYRPPVPGAVDDETLFGLTETFELIYMDDADAGEVVADATFTAADEYEVDQRWSPAETRPQSEFDTSGFSTSAGPPQTEPDFIVGSPDGTRIEVYDAEVYAYPSTVSPDALVVDKSDAVALNTSPETVQEKVESEEGWEIVLENRPEKIDVGDDRPDTQPEPEPEPEPESEDDITVGGLSLDGLERFLDEIFIGADAIVQRQNGDLLVGWESVEGEGANIQRESAVLSGDPDIAGQMIQQVLEAYYENAALAASTVERIQQALEEAPIDLPEPPTAASRDADAGGSDDPPEETADSGIPADSPLNQFSNPARAYLEGNIDPRELNPTEVTALFRAVVGETQVAAEQREPSLEPLTRALLFDEVSRSIEEYLFNIESGPGGGIMRVGVKAMLTDEAAQALRGTDPFTLAAFGGQPVLQVGAPGEAPADIVDGLEHAYSMLDPENDEFRFLRERFEVIGNATNRDILRGGFDLRKLFIPSEEIRKFGPANIMYIEGILNALQQIDPAVWAAQYVYALQTGADIRDEIAQRIGETPKRGSARWLLDRALDEYENGNFDPVDFTRRYFNRNDRAVPNDLFDMNDIPAPENMDDDPPWSDEAEQEQSADSFDADTGRTAPGVVGSERQDEMNAEALMVEYLKDNEPAEVQVVSTDPDKSLGLAIRIPDRPRVTVESGIPVADEVALELRGEIPMDIREEGKVVATAVVTRQDIQSFEVVGQEQQEPEPETTPSPTTAEEPPERTPERGTETPGSASGEPGSTTTPAGGDGDTTIGSADIEQFDAEEVTIEDLDISIGGDVEVGVDDLDIETVESIESEIEDDIGG